MRRADRLAAAGAPRHLIHAHRLVGPALTVPQARRAQAAASLRRRGVALLRVPIADEPATAAAQSEAGRTGCVSVPPVPPLGADALVGRAVLQSARRAHVHVLLTRRLAVHATLGDTVVRAEVLGADRAAIRAGLTAAVVVPADDQGRRRSAAMRTGHDPGGRTGRAWGPLRAEGRATPPSRLEPPLGALHQERGFDEL